MMAWLGQWLKDIVLIVLFAAFVDLLVPENALRKYVKLTIRLMILITILAPLIEWLKPGLDIRDAAFDAVASGESGIPPLSSVLEAGGRLRMEAESRAARLTEEHIAGQIRRQVGRTFPVSVRSVQVRLGPGEQEGTAEIAAVRLVLAPINGETDPARSGLAERDAVVRGDAGSGAGERNGGVGGAETQEWPEAGWNGIGRPDAVRPVRVETVEVSLPGRQAADRANTGAPGKEATPAATFAGTDAAAPEHAGHAAPADKKRLAAEVAIQVGLWWGIDGERIDVSWAEGEEEA